MLTNRLFASGAMLLLAAACFTRSARAVENGTSYDPVTSSLPGAAYVGEVNGASGVYIGNGYVLTATHVGSSNFVLDGVTYDEVANSAEQIGSTDLTLFKLQTSPDLPDLTLALTPPVPGVTSVSMIGFGGAVTVDGVRTATYGENTVTQINQSVTLDNTYTSEEFYTLTGTFGTGPLSFTNTAQLVSGDSGGGDFTDIGGQLELAGLNDASLQDDSGATVGSAMIQISDYAAIIDKDAGITVPEPSVPLLILFAALLLGSGWKAAAGRLAFRRS